MIRDRLLTDRALERKFQKSDIVIKQLKWWQDKLVYQQVKYQIASSIVISEEQINQFYMKNKKNYTNNSGKILPIENIRNQVKADLYRQEYMDRIVHKVLSLKNEYKIEIDNQYLTILPIESENHPSSIDLYVVKKGGTFPRQAYPTIDMDWNAWE